MKQLVSIEFEDGAECNAWINKHNILRKDVVSIQGVFLGCVARLYVSEELLPKVIKKQKENKKMWKTTQSIMIGIIAFMLLVMLILDLTGVF